MATAAMLDIWNCKILLAARVQRADTHHTFQTLSKLVFCGDIAIFWFSKMAAAAILDFQIRAILLAMPDTGM